MLRSFATRPQKAKRRQAFDLTALIWLRESDSKLTFSAFFSCFQADAKPYSRDNFSITR
jgi:hypothetical protein